VMAMSVNRRIERNLPAVMGQRDPEAMIRVRSTDPIRASGLVPRQQAGHMTASDLMSQSAKRTLARRGPSTHDGGRVGTFGHWYYSSIKASKACLWPGRPSGRWTSAVLVFCGAVGNPTGEISEQNAPPSGRYAHAQCAPPPPPPPAAPLRNRPTVTAASSRTTPSSAKLSL
jgi:hypothetical protein